VNAVVDNSLYQTYLRSVQCDEQRVSVKLIHNTGWLNKVIHYQESALNHIKNH